MYVNWESERFCGFSELKVSFKLPILRGGNFKADDVWLIFVGFNSQFLTKENESIVPKKVFRWLRTIWRRLK